MTETKIDENLPAWRHIYDRLLSNAESGDVVTYAAVASVLGISTAQATRRRHVIYRARRHLGQERRRWLAPVPRIGYRLMQPHEHVSVANGHKTKAQRQYDLALTVSNVTDLALLTPEQLQSFDTQRRILGTLAAFAHAHEQRLNTIEDVLRKNGMM